MPIGSTAATVNLRPDLAAFFEYDLLADQAGFVASKVLPVIDVGLQADNPGKLPLEQLLFQGETSRASGSGYSRGNFSFERFSYATQEHGWEEPVDDRDAQRYKHILQAEQVAVSRALSVVQRNAERRAANLVFNATTWNGASLTTAVQDEWDDAANCTPVVDVAAARNKIYDNSGLWANALVINYKVFLNLKNSEEIIDRINSAGAGNASKASDITAAMLAQVFDLDHVIVAGASRNNAVEGATPDPAQIWSDEYAMVCRVATGADIREPGLGRTFHWSEDGSSIGGTIEQYRDETVRSEIYRVRHDVDEVIMYKEAGHLLSNITT